MTCARSGKPTARFLSATNAVSADAWTAQNAIGATSALITRPLKCGLQKIRDLTFAPHPLSSLARSSPAIAERRRGFSYTPCRRLSSSFEERTARRAVAARRREVRSRSVSFVRFLSSRLRSHLLTCYPRRLDRLPERLQLVRVQLSVFQPSVFRLSTINHQLSTNNFYRTRRVAFAVPLSPVFPGE